MLARVPSLPKKNKSMSSRPSSSLSTTKSPSSPVSPPKVLRSLRSKLSAQRTPVPRLVCCILHTDGFASDTKKAHHRTDIRLCTRSPICLSFSSNNLITPKPLLEMIEAGKARDYPRARAVHDRLLPVTRNVYHRSSHMEGTLALKHGLVTRGILEHAIVRSGLLPLQDGAEQEIHAAFKSASLGKVTAPKSG
jgi:hypothetical protein